MITTSKQILLCILVEAVLISVASSMKQEKECLLNVCTQTRGYFEYKGLFKSQIRWSIKNLQRQQTTFVLHLKGVTRSSNQQRWLRIQTNVYPFPVTFVDTNEDRVIVLDTASEIYLQMKDYDLNARFRIDFFIGCEILEGAEINVMKEISQTKLISKKPPLQPFSFFPFDLLPQILSAPTCWLIVPAIEETIEPTLTSQQVQLQKIYAQLGQTYPLPPPITTYIPAEQTYTTLQTTSLSNDTFLTVTDLITGRTVLSTEEETLDVKTFIKNEEGIRYKLSRTVSTLLMVELNCENSQSCDETEFNFTANALRQSDVECIEREQKCRFGIGLKEYNCTAPEIPVVFLLLNTSIEDLGNSACPAFNLILQYNLARSQTLLDDKESHVGERAYLNDNAQKNLRRCTDYRRYCTSRSCGLFRRFGCKKMCMMVKSWHLCPYFLRRSIFA